jgi:hypothetical protein
VPFVYTCCRCVGVVARVQAFFFPTRLAVAFCISVLATVTFCVLTIRAIISIRGAIKRADASSVRTIFTGLASVQNLFYSTTSQEVRVLVVLSLDYLSLRVAMYAMLAGGLAVCV